MYFSFPFLIFLFVFSSPPYVSVYVHICDIHTHMCTVGMCVHVAAKGRPGVS